MMSGDSYYDYVFTDFCSIVDGTRWHWVECLCADLRSFLTGIRVSGGGGNCTFPIALFAGVDFVSDLLGGDTKYLERCSQDASCCPCVKPHGRFDQAELAAAFIAGFFDGAASHMPHLLWHGVRDGLTHTFMPNQFLHDGRSLRFTFFSWPPEQPSFIERSGDTIVVAVNAYSLFDQFLRAVARYERRLRTEEGLQTKFRTAWASLEAHQQVVGCGDRDRRYAREMTLAFCVTREGASSLFGED